MSVLKIVFFLSSYLFLLLLPHLRNKIETDRQNKNQTKTQGGNFQSDLIVSNLGAKVTSPWTLQNKVGYELKPRNIYAYELILCFFSFFR